LGKIIRAEFSSIRVWSSGQAGCEDEAMVAEAVVDVEELELELEVEARLDMN
jgi:hypothetical protein